MADARLDAFFAARGWRVFPFQREAWDAFLAGESGLVHAPTGTGKTLAVWGGPMLEAMRRGNEKRKGKARTLRVLWITPLRALAADTQENLAEVVRELGLDWITLRRTGDSRSTERAKVKRGECDALITTPESLALLLSYDDSVERFAALDAVVVDEWHELMGTKRGVLLELALARLRTLAPRMRTWGLSATLGNLEQARDVLLGPAATGRLVHGDADKRIEIQTLLPDSPSRFPWAGHLGLSQLPQVLAALERSRTTLVFTNTRSQAELWHRALEAVWIDAPETLGLHHGSIDKRLREQVEERLRRGELRCVVATSSLDLGVDFAAVEQVIQVGSPRGVARLLQRAGRAGHQPGAPSRILCVPTHNLELVEIAAARRAVAARAVEARVPLRNSIDVLAQHLVTCALARGFDAREMLDEVRRTHAFAQLRDSQWHAALALVTQGGASLAAYPDFQKVVRDETGRYVVASKRIARLHRLAIGTIVSDGSFAVKFLRGGAIGHLEEQFLARVKPGETFLFAGRALELVRTKDMTAYVRLSRSRQAAVPRWMGAKMPLSSELADTMRAVLADPAPAEPEMAFAAPMLALQHEASRLPAPGELLVERLRARDGEHLFLYPFAGRLAHEGLAALLSFRIARRAPASLSFAINDYGLGIGARRLPDFDADALRELLSPEGLAADLVASLNMAELARRRFREIARIAGLVFQGLPGQAKSLRQVTASSTLIFDVLREHEPDHVLLAQAVDEVLEGQLELRRLDECLRRIEGQSIVLESPRRLTPFAFPLWAEAFRGHLSSEDWRARVQRMAEQLERAA